MLSLVGALTHAGQHRRARSLREDAVSAALPLDDPALLARVITSFEATRMWQNSEYGTVDDELVDLIENTLDQLPSGEQSLRCRLLTTLAFELDGAASERGYEASADAVQLARTLGDPDVLSIAILARSVQSFRHDGLAERRRLGAELLGTPGTSVLAETWAHEILIKASCGAGDFDAADAHAREAARIAERYEIGSAAFNVTWYRALRAAVAGDFPAADRFYREAAVQMAALGRADPGAAISVLGRFCLLAMQDRVAEIAAELAPFAAAMGRGSGVPELYALTLAAGGHGDEARAQAGQPHPIRHDQFWLIATAVRGLLGVAIDDKPRARSAYQALLPFGDRPAGAETGLFTLWPTAQILGDLSCYLGLPGAQAYYQQALAVAERTRAEPWRTAALKRLAAGTRDWHAAQS
jgi:hypothetical protein